MTEAAYDAIAEWYDQSIRKGTLLPADEFLTYTAFEGIGSLDGQVICDVACGQGEMARQMARRGARVIGVDISIRLLEIARREEEANPQGIIYYHDDAQTLSSLSDAQFDGAFCHFALMDIPDLSATAGSISRILRPGGWLVAAITHPCFQTPPNQSYFEEGFWRSDNPNGVRGQVGAYHRTLSTYINAFGRVGLLIERMTEPQLPDRDVPPVLVFQCRK